MHANFLVQNSILPPCLQASSLKHLQLSGIVKPKRPGSANFDKALKTSSHIYFALVLRSRLKLARWAGVSIEETFKAVKVLGNPSTSMRLDSCSLRTQIEREISLSMR